LPQQAKKGQSGASFYIRINLCRLKRPSTACSSVSWSDTGTSGSKVSMKFWYLSRLPQGCGIMLFTYMHYPLFETLVVTQVKASLLNVIIEPLRGKVSFEYYYLMVYSVPSQSVPFLCWHHSVCVGIKGNPPYMDHQLTKAVKSESTWTFGWFCPFRLYFDPVFTPRWQRMVNWKLLSSKC
jgi:hypothetical protein